MWTKLATASLSLLLCLLMNPLFAQDAISPSADDHEDAQLGIEVSDSPGVGVHVSVVAIDGPADLSGIRPGDYVVAIDGKPVESPDDLIKVVRAQEPGTEVTVGVWRNGTVSERKVVLATARSGAHLIDRAWLGVTLEANENGGARIGQVIPGGPAADAGLKVGDVIVAINDTKTESAIDLVDAMETFKSGETITLTLAGEAEVRRKVILGAMAAAPPIFSHRLPVPELNEMLPDLLVPPPAWREEISELRRQLQDLREAIRGKGKDILDLDDEGDSVQPDSIQPQPNDASNLGTDNALFQFMQYPSGRSNNRQYHHPGYPHPYSYPHPYPQYPGYGYGYGFVPSPYSSYYGGYPGYRPYVRPYYRPGVRIYVGRFGFEYYL